jgi:hypothetical protein
VSIGSTAHQPRTQAAHTTLLKKNSDVLGVTKSDRAPRDSRVFHLFVRISSLALWQNKEISSFEIYV